MLILKRLALLFFSTGYLITTAISRTLWSGRKLWLYPIIAMALFVIQFEVMNVGLGGCFRASGSSAYYRSGCVRRLCLHLCRRMASAEGAVGKQQRTGREIRAFVYYRSPAGYSRLTRMTPAGSRARGFPESPAPRLPSHGIRA
jgi:hypothetical protein